MKVCDTLERLMCNFLWERVEEGKGSHLVSWEVVDRIQRELE